MPCTLAARMGAASVFDNKKNSAGAVDHRVRGHALREDGAYYRMRSLTIECVLVGNEHTF